nr:MAG TPA: Cytosine specific methyltransferase [Caudoviricetes sp.]
MFIDKPIVVLSLFDGMSCGQIALHDIGIPIKQYYASEIDKHAIKQTQCNFPETIQLGDVERWREWNIDWASVDLILAGSPCQGFSLAGKMLGHDDPRSRLFWVFLDILRHTQKHSTNVKFLLENVRMRPNDERQINESLGLMPVVINSSLVSAQNRVRLYWTNIRTRQEGLFGETYTDIPQPEDRGILIQDILENSVDEKYFLSPSVWSRHQIPSDIECDSVRDPWLSKNMRELDDKACTLLSCSYKGARANGMTIVLAVGSLRFFGETEFRTMKTMKSPCLNAQRREDGNNQTVVELAVGTWRTHKVDGGFREMVGDKSPCIPARARNDGSGQPCVRTDRVLRRLTPTECARLQTIPEWYRWECSDTQSYKMLGNGWTVEVIKHILSFYTEETNQ